ncbi:MAG: NUDIX hydrolase [Meiothermus sp.]|nr:NUDIX hydrolase [Meiothermus sp.]
MHQELLELALRYGKPLEPVVTLGDNSYLAVASPRIAEVCLVLRRPGDTFLTMTKGFYPQGLYRLPTGGMETGEMVSEALEREIWEELGLEATIKRFLAHITYQHNQGRLFHSYCFLIEAEGEPSPQDHAEQISGFSSANAEGLLGIARQLEALQEQESEYLKASWSDWGKFRAVVHRTVAQALRG